MATLIKQNLGGHRIRRCAANCYNAKGTTCCCICGGTNHGIGYKKAVDNSNEAVQALLSRKGTQGVQAKLPVVGETIPIEVY